MKNIYISLILILITLSNVAAKNPTGLKFSIHTGISKPLSPENFSKSYRTGSNIGVQIGMQLSSRFIIEGAICYNDLTFDKNGYENTIDLAEDIIDINGEKAAIVNFFSKIKLVYPPKTDTKATSYFYGGIGINRISKKEVQIMTEIQDIKIPGKTESVLGTEFGIGLNFLLENTILFVEVGVNYGFTEGKNEVFLPLKFGLSF